MVYLVSGLPGTGKSSVCRELQKRGYDAVDADQAFGYQEGASWLWDDADIRKVLNSPRQRTVFVCGSSSNRDEYVAYFKEVFILRVDNRTLAQRIHGRKSHNFGKDPKVLAKLLEHNKGLDEYIAKRGWTPIDATRPVDEVVDDIVQKVGLSA